MDPLYEEKEGSFTYASNNPIAEVDPQGLKENKKKKTWKCKNPKPPKCARNAYSNFYWCRGCEASCVQYCNDKYITEPGDEWERCIAACGAARTTCQSGGKFKFEAQW